VRHYSGGLLEWSEYASDSAGAGTERASGSKQADAGSERTRPTASAAAARAAGNLSARLVDALADRSVGSLFRLWIEIVLLCGVAYWSFGWLDRTSLTMSGTPVGTGVHGLFAAVYFSAVTATSVGYGDIIPMGAARVLAIVESAAGLILFGCVVSKFVSRRQEALIREIHYVAFEDRLGRVRTNLLLVRAELQATARLCEGQEMPPPEALARVESAAMVFVGELHAVHDLLYRPQETPDEAVLEAILAGLTSVFREFTELLLCVNAQRADRSPAIASSIAAMTRLAREICGDCVPRQFAPALKTWMDQIQQLARDIERA
jgi:hypothetical protein